MNFCFQLVGYCIVPGPCRSRGPPSAMVIQVLTQMGAKFKSIDVLNEPTIRDGIKQYSDWPTIPQLYVKGEFIGGSDIVREMYESGELAELFSNKGVELEDA